MNSILQSIKKVLGIAEDYTEFDVDVIMYINTVLAVLTQIGVGPANGFSITGPDETWYDYIDDSSNFEAVKTYICIKVRLLFDPPSSSAVADAMRITANELEWRLYVNSQTPI